MITGHATLENATEALNFGADDCLVKPVDPRDLVRAVKQRSAGLVDWLPRRIGVAHPFIRHPKL